VDLLRTFGEEFKITRDPAYDPDHVPHEMLDPWMAQIPCERQGLVIYPYGGETLALQCDRRNQIANRVAAIPGVKLDQDGDLEHEKTFIFDVALFDQIAAIVKPRKKHAASQAGHLRPFQFSAATTVENPLSAASETVG
jgi:hypothetical protein